VKKKRRRSTLLFKTETVYGTAPQPGMSIHLLRKPVTWGRLPLSDDNVRMLQIEGRIALTPKGVRKAAAFLRTAADRLEGLVRASRRPQKRPAR
jgi:hypothetical protein